MAENRPGDRPAWEHTERVLRAIRDVNRMIVDEDDPARLIDRACRNLTDNLGYHSVWIALLDDTGRTVTASAVSGFEAAAITRFGASLDVGYWPDCLQEAVVSDAVVTIADPLQQCPECPLAPVYEGRAGMCRRLHHDGKTFGVIVVSVPRPYVHDHEARSLFREVAGDLGFALHRIATAARLRAQERYLSTILTTTVDGLCVIDGQGRIVDCNDAFCAMIGYSREELLGMTAAAIDALETQEQIAARMQAVIASGAQTFETKHRRRDGRVCEVEVSVSYLHDPGGLFVAFCRDITLRKQAEAALREREVMWRNILIRIPQIGIALDTQARIVFANEYFLSLTGWTELEIIGRDWFEFCIPEPVRAEVRAVYDAALATGSAVSISNHENEIVTRAGTRRLVAWSNVVTQDARGQAIGVTCLGVDLTDHRRAEEQLCRNTMLLDAVRTAQSLYIEHGDPQSVFDALLRGLLQLTESEHGYLAEVIRPDDGGRGTRALAATGVDLSGFATLAGEPMIVNDLAGGLPGGGVVPDAAIISSYMELPLLAGGELVGVAGVANRPSGYEPEQARFLEPYLNAGAGLIDSLRARVRERQATVALQESEARVRRKLQAVLDPDEEIGELTLADLFDTEAVQAFMDDLYDLTGFGIGIIDRSGQVVISSGWQDVCRLFHRANPQTRRLCEESDAEQLANLTPGEFRTSYCKNGLRDICTPIVIGGVPVGSLCLGQFFYDVEEPDRDWFRDRARSFGFDAEAYLEAIDRTPRWSRQTVDRALRFFARFADYVSTLSHTNLKLARILDEQQRSEDERERLRTQLGQAQRLESVGRLAGGVAHDFNNMLNVILGHTELLLEDTPADSSQRGSLTEISKAARHSADLTGQLLTFARKQTIAPRVLDLNETITSMILMLRRLIGEDIDLIWRPGQALQRLRVDPSQINQVLANLVVNARDAIGRRHGTIVIETGMEHHDATSCAYHPELVPGDYVVLTVGDDGCGMDEQTQASIFEPFYTTKAAGEGTGLGLATVYGIAKQNHGLVTVDSAPGRGSTFRLCLPAFQGVDDRAAGPAADRGEVPIDGQETILLVEDEATIRGLTAIMLERLGYRVLAAESSAEALRLGQQHGDAIHLLLTDVVMPDMNGRDLAVRLGRANPDLKCLFMSGYTADVIARHGVLESDVAFLQKPFTRQMLGQRVRDVLAGSQATLGRLPAF